MIKKARTYLRDAIHYLNYVKLGLSFLLKGKKVYFLSFADNKYNKSLQRIEKQAFKFCFFGIIPLFSEIACLSEDEFDGNYWETYKNRFLNDPKFGYFSWKSYLVKRKLLSLHENDILLYADAGCHLNNSTWNARFRMLEYLKIAEQSNGMLLFEQSGEQMKERYWTKGDCFDYFDARDNLKYSENQQTLGGIFFIKKNELSSQIIDEWFHICHFRYDLITDKSSISPNLEGFKMHRHEQSILSLLSVKYNLDRVPAWETWQSPDDWDKMKNYPIQARRDLNKQKQY